MSEDPRTEDLAGQISALSWLVKSEGWKILHDIIMERIAAEEKVMDLPVDGIPGVLQQEYRKGSLHELRAILNTPHTIIEASKEAMDLLQEEEEDGS